MLTFVSWDTSGGTSTGVSEATARSLVGGPSAFVPWGTSGDDESLSPEPDSEDESDVSEDEPELEDELEEVSSESLPLPLSDA